MVLIECTRFPEGTGRENLLQRIRQTGGKNLLLSQYAHMFLPGANPDRVAACLKRVQSVSAPFIEQLMVSTIAWDQEHMVETLRSLQVPLLLLQSTGTDRQGRRCPLSKVSDSPWVRFAASHVPDLQAELIEHAGHFPHLDQPQATSASIERFMTQVFSQLARPRSP